MKCFHIIVCGIVQGVGFRAFTKRIADAFELKGYVRNLINGSVEIEVEGDEKRIKKFIKTLKEGPVYAQVEAVHIKPVPTKNYTQFEILY